MVSAGGISVRAKEITKEKLAECKEIMTYTSDGETVEKAINLLHLLVTTNEFDELKVSQLKSLLKNL